MTLNSIFVAMLSSCFWAQPAKTGYDSYRQHGVQLSCSFFLRHWSLVRAAQASRKLFDKRCRLTQCSDRGQEKRPLDEASRLRTPQTLKARLDQRRIEAICCIAHILPSHSLSRPGKCWLRGGPHEYKQILKLSSCTTLKVSSSSFLSPSMTRGTLA